MTALRTREGWTSWLAKIALLAVVYVLLARVGLELAHLHENVSLVWPPTGMALAAVFLWGRAVLPGIFLGALATSFLWADPGPAAAVGIATGNSLEALVGAELLRRVGFRPNFGRPRDVLAFLLLGVLLCTSVSASVGVASLLAFTPLPLSEAGPVWLAWWLGDQGGALILAPVLLLLVHGTPSWEVLLRRWEYWLVLAFLLGVGSLLFLSPTTDDLGATVLLPCFPVLVWAGTRHGSRGAMTASFVITTSTLLATVYEFGPLVVESPTETAILLWAYSGVIGLMAFALAAVVEERDAADRRYREGEAERLRAERATALLLERERLTREMHDGLGGQLVSALSLVEGGRGEPREVAELLRRALDEIRVVIDSLDPQTTDFATSLGKLRARVTPLLQRNGIALSWQVDDSEMLQQIPPEGSLHLLRIVQEAVTNAVRHAQPGAIDVRVSVREASRSMKVSVRDDGCGVGEGSVEGGRGIRNMRVRAEELGAFLRIDAASPGTRVALELSLPPAGGGPVSPSGRA